MKKAWLWVAGAAALAVAMTVHLGKFPTAPAPPGAGTPSGPTSEFLARHWPDALPAQGEPPAGFSALEASLDPGACGQCHERQFEDWKSSLHSEAIGPGILWQFHGMGPKEANSCMRCHAPLAEQKALLAIERRWETAPRTPPPDYVPPNLHRQGLVCAACHVRRHARIGPPPRGELRRASDSALPHGGFAADAGFEDSRFCAVCHQLSEGKRLNGKPLVNTFEEWRASAVAGEGRSCQSCHMPDRRHLWRGIHDADMVRQALRVSLQVAARAGHVISVQAELANVGAGHHLPTYLVPEIVATLQLVDERGRVRKEIARRVIGRRANLELTQEIYDTRIAFGERLTFGGEFPLPRAKGWTVELRVFVHPAKHYERLFESVLARDERPPAEAVPLLREALARAGSRGYELYRLSRPVPAA